MPDLNIIKELLEKEGFRTSWTNPFMEWQRPDLYAGKPEVMTGEILYVPEPPVSWIAPFDLAVVSVRINDGGIFFELSLYYVNVMEDQTEASVFNAIHDLQQSWHTCLVSFYRDVAEKFSLRWDTEHDYYIEDTLFGHLESEESVLNILIMMQNINRLSSITSHITIDCTSDIPEIDCKLKIYRDYIDLLERIERFSHS
jgi:hypothetical protein